MKKLSPISQKIVAIAIIVFGIVIVGLQWWKGETYQRLSERGVAVSGIVVEEIGHPGSRRNGVRSWTEADVTYQVDAKTYTERVREGRPYSAGDTIELRYLPEDPSVSADSEVLKDSQEWDSYVQRYALAVICILGGFFILINARKT